MLNKLNYKFLTLTLVLASSLNYIFFTYRFFKRENGYIFGDWLINYSGGFTRRGLSGDILLSFTNFFNLDITYLTFFFVTFIYCLFVYVFIKILFRSNIDWIILLMIFSPSTFLFTLYDPLAIGRKEILFFLFFGIYLLCRNYRFFKFLGPLLSIIIILIHELFAFMMPFFFIARYLNIKNFYYKNYYDELFISFASVITLSFVFYFSNADTEIICNTIRELSFSSKICLSINDLNLHINNDGIFDTRRYVLDKYYLFYYGLFLLLIIFPIFLCLKNNFKIDLKLIFFFLIFSIFPILILFIIVNDWGRYLHIFSMFWILLLLKNNLKITRPEKKIFKILIIFLFAISWYMPHCCPEIHFSKIKYKPGLYYFFERVNIRFNN
tara:strand:+ start:764 stop:1909 length:1146 start_codon:yes stop_codon:yes gene_type:complete